MMNAFLDPGAPRKGIERYICTAAEDDLGWWATNFVLWPLACVYFFVFRLIW